MSERERAKSINSKPLKMFTVRRAKYTLKALPSDLSNQSKECRMKN